MGFQQPPSLPDYSKLTFMLNNSGVQKWNPAVYDILKQLIYAVQQSQNVITNDIANSSGGLTSVSVDAAGALSGDGTPGSPLAVKVDGTTIAINGSDQLAVLSAFPLITKEIIFSDATVKSWTTTPQTLVTGVAKTLLIPIALFNYANIIGASNNSINANYFYTGVAVSAFPLATVITGAGTGYRFTSASCAQFNIQSATDLIGLGITLTPTASATGFYQTTDGFHVLIVYISVPTIIS